ncbi:twin-arginine translocase TatA/TatE family subunit [Salirhabdus sp. Marseille-P4669]|uniref:twin-arginine translocase TatA/TatE family subunit n=1 Tax=Salirhabdus sp. Marseille-P4669 TaxID=2042310 RepID=UPI000C7AFBD3|nr:twin-arginine translocase TatA/TatE family subunit [Salirhabdus sp. Marseille-P4669]
MLSNIGIPGLILILVIALVVFGPSKLPDIGRAVGTSLKEFKRAASGIMSDNDESAKTKKIESPDKK